jgi:hypothetical protein
MRVLNSVVSGFLRRFVVPAAAAGLVLTGVAGGERTASADEVIETVAYAPPAPRVEVVGVAPSPNHFWVPGYYGPYRAGYGYSWYPGRWEVRRPGLNWVNPGWVQGGRGWHYRNGGWGGFHGGGFHGGGFHGGGFHGGGFHGGGFHGGGFHGGGFHGGHR